MIGILIVSVIAFGASIFLVILNYYLNKIDKEVEDVALLLPGYNCGACGFAGCFELAKQIVHHQVEPRQCKPIKEEQYQKIIAYLKEHKIKTD
ncbi:MAG: (Fe-S)-binding protein [Bacilli bacterium]|jgi:electron transport complex protein RnfB